ncbi:hypothetical protein BJV78DRAFT_1154628 [Lactifluus subvellereus]|nr:hypothetical protein BJV78DRAFT_1154628 [Lactifluus subvellereus]
MLSPLKLALIAIISFTTLAVATPTLEARSQDPKALISDANWRLERAVLPFYFVTPANATSDCFVPIIEEVVEIVGGLLSALEVSSLSGCDCTSQDILVLTATTLEIILGSLGVAYGSDAGLTHLLGGLVALIVQLVDVVLALVGGLVGELVLLLIGNGCAGTILGLNLGGLINSLGLGSLLGHIL